MYFKWLKPIAWEGYRQQWDRLDSLVHSKNMEDSVHPVQWTTRSRGLACNMPKRLIQNVNREQQIMHNTESRYCEDNMDYVCYAVWMVRQKTYTWSEKQNIEDKFSKQSWKMCVSVQTNNTNLFFLGLHDIRNIKHCDLFLFCYIQRGK